MFEGEWVHGRRQGKGKLVNKIGEIKHGVWKDDKRVNWEGEEVENERDSPIKIQINKVVLPEKGRHSKKIFQSQ